MKLEENIARMEQELADMKKQLERQNKLELKGGEGYGIQAIGVIFKITTTSTSSRIRRGTFRATKELAEIADKNMATRNRLEAYVHQIQGDGEGNYYIMKHQGRCVPDNYSVRNTFVLGAVYMQEETAEILCEALNKGEIEL